MDPFTEGAHLLSNVVFCRYASVSGCRSSRRFERVAVDVIEGAGQRDRVGRRDEMSAAVVDEFADASRIG